MGSHQPSDVVSEVLPAGSTGLARVTIRLGRTERFDRAEYDKCGKAKQCMCGSGWIFMGRS